MRSVPDHARALFQNPLFRMSLDHAERVENAWAYALSAERGLVSADAVLAPYDRTLNAMPLSVGGCRVLRSPTPPSDGRAVR